MELNEDSPHLHQLFFLTLNGIIYTQDGLPKGLGPPRGGVPRIFYMKKLSVFIDESGDFGKYDAQSPYYIFALVLHDQSDSIADIVDNLEYRVSSISERSLVHCGPIIRQEEFYRYTDIDERRKIFNSLYFFTVKAPIKVKIISVNKRECDSDDELALSTKLVRQLSGFIKENIEFFVSFDEIVIYYDNGQKQLSRIIHNTFTALLSNVSFKKIVPDEYKLQQAADMFCTLQLLALKAENNSLSMSEKNFFEGQNKLKKNYLKILKKKAFKVI